MNRRAKARVPEVREWEGDWYVVNGDQYLWHDGRWHDQAWISEDGKPYQQGYWRIRTAAERALAKAMETTK